MTPDGTPRLSHRDSDAEGLTAVEPVIGAGEPQRIGRFKFLRDGQRWEWSDAVARMHGYEPGTVSPSTELLSKHKHPEDRQRVAGVLERVLAGEPFSSRHRIIDRSNNTRWVVVVGDVLCDSSGRVVGTTGFYIDVTETLQSDVTAVVSEVAEMRAHIEQAKGVLMAAYGISAQRAFEILSWRSQESNLKLRELAARFLAALAGTMSADSQTRVDHALLTLR